ncbi:hypothetical protein A2U01_0092011, partial [Trifolium medium]|nr:hypothetical protein [Trifolium medium]
VFSRTFPTEARLKRTPSITSDSFPVAYLFVAVVYGCSKATPLEPICCEHTSGGSGGLVGGGIMVGPPAI